EAELAIGVRFGPGRELRPFDADVDAAAMRAEVAERAHCVPELVAQVWTKGIGEGDVRDDAAFKEAVGSAASAVEDLVWHDEVERRVVLAQAAHRADRDDPLDTKALERVDVRARRYLSRREAMPAPVPWQERARLLTQHARHDGVARRAKGRLRHDLVDVGQPLHRIEAAAADNAQPSTLCLHDLSLSHTIVHVFQSPMGRAPRDHLWPAGPSSLIGAQSIPYAGTASLYSVYTTSRRLTTVTIPIVPD